MIAETRAILAKRDCASFAVLYDRNIYPAVFIPAGVRFRDRWSKIRRDDLSMRFNDYIRSRQMIRSLLNKYLQPQSI